MQLIDKNDTITWPYTLAKLAATFGIVLGIINLIGWTFFVWMPDEYKSLVVVIKPNTAFCLLLLGIALWIRADIESKHSPYYAQVASGTVFLVAMLTLFQYLFDIDVGIDQGLFHDHTKLAETFLPPGRMTPFSAINFVLLSFPLFFLDSKLIRYPVHQVFVILVFLNTYFQLLGSIYKIGILSEVFGVHRDVNQFGMILVIAFIFMGLGILFARPNKGVMALFTSNASGSVLARRVIPPALLLSILFGYIEIVGEKNGNLEGQLGTSLLVMGITVFITAIILLNAYFVNRMDDHRKLAENALLQSQLKLQAIIDNTNLVISIIDIGGNFILANKQFEWLYHVNASEILGKNIYDVLPKQYADQIFESHFKVVQSRMPVAGEEAISIDYQCGTYLSNKFLINDAMGVPYAICNISTDVTEIKKSYEILSERERRLSVALRSAKAGTWAWEIQKDVILWDEYLHRLFGLKPGTFPGYYEAQFNYIHPDDRSRVHKEIQQVLESGDEYESEFRIIHADGMVRYIATRGRVYRDDNGQAMRMAGVCWDTTERRCEEEELRNAKEVAEHLAEEAEVASRSKSALLAAVSHDIRAPLNDMIGATTELLNTPLTKEQRNYAEKVEAHGEALLTVINKILDYPRDESGRMDMSHIQGKGSQPRFTIPLKNTEENSLREDIKLIKKNDTMLATQIINEVIETAKEEAKALSRTRLSLIDMNRIHAVFGNDETQVKEFMKIFINTTAHMIKETKMAVARRDVEACKNLFLRLKGSSGNSGVMQIHSLSLIAEENVKKGDWLAVERGLKSISNTFKKMKVEAMEKFHLS